MKIKLLLALAIAGILVTITTAGLLVRGYLKAPDDSPGGGRSTPERVLDDLAAVVGLDAGGPQDEAGPESTREAARVESAPRVRGRVDLFGACAGESQGVVYALSEATSLEQLMVILEPPTDEDTVERTPPLASAPIDAGGEFELVLAAGTRRVHLIALGDHAYLLESQAITLEAGSARATLTPYCGGRVTGRVFLPSEAGAPALPAVDARVELSSVRKERAIGVGRLVRHARTDEHGAFELPALPLPGDYQIEVDAEGFAAARLDAAGVLSGETRVLEFHLTPGAELVGRVLDPDGHAVAQAEVICYVEGSVERSGFGKRTAQTDAQGNFHLRALTPERLSLFAKRDGYLESHVARLELEEGELREELLLVLEPGASVAGRVRWPDGSPLADELVELEFDPARKYARFGSLDASRGAAGEARTDANGEFRITGLGKGPFSLTVSARPRGSAPSENERDRWNAQADDVQPGTDDLELIMAQPLTVSGIVRDTAGRPLDEFSLRSVQLMETEIGVLARDGRDDSFPDEHGGHNANAAPGAFRLGGLSAGRWSFYATAEGHATSDPITLELPEQADVALEFALEPAATVSGLVLSPLGAPISGAKVTPEQGGPSWRALASGAPSAPRATSADDGSFSLGGLPAGELYLAASADGFAGGEPIRLVLEQGQRLENIELSLREGAMLTGEVFDHEGAAVRGAVVQLVSSPDFDVLLSHTDAQGRFEFEHLDAGTWQVIAMPARERLQTLASDEGNTSSAVFGEMEIAIIEVEDGGSEHVVLGAPPEDPVRLSGVVLGDGRPMADVVLGFYKEGSDVRIQSRRTTANARGEFSVTLDGGGRYVISAGRSLHGPMDESHVEFLVEVPAAETHEITLELPGATLSGVLLDAGGRPAPHARVTLTPHGAVSTRCLNSRYYTQSRSDEEGRFLLDFVPAGSYTLAAGGMPAGGLFERSAKYGRVLREVELAADQDLEVAPITLPASASAGIVVRDEGGRPVEGAAIFARNAEGELLEILATLMTDASGACLYPGLAPGRYSFSARRGDLASLESALVTVSEEAPARVALELQEGTLLRVQLRDGDNQPTVGDVYLYDSEGRELQRMVSLHDVLKSSDGETFQTNEVVLGPLAPGKYRVVATQGELKDRRPVVLTGRTERKLILRLQ